jgi:outer membrane biosynthesis protein TonB
LYRHMRVATCASLIVFGVVLAGGAMALVPSLVDRLSVSRTELSPAPTCASTQAASKGKDCIVRHDPPVGTVQPVQPAQVEASSEIDNPPQRTLPQQHAAALPDQPIETPEIVAPVHSEEASATVHSPEVAAPVHETVPQPPHAEERARAKPTRQTKSRLSHANKTARQDQTAEPRTHKALAAMRRFEDSRRDIPMSAYAAEGPPRRIIIRPTSIQDVYYYSARPWE